MAGERGGRDQDLRIGPRLTIPASEIEVGFSRSGGPGGQNVNKVETKVTLRFAPAASRVLSPAERERLVQALGSRLSAAGELVVHASRFRRQARHLADARERLADWVRDALAPRKKRRATRPTKGSRERRLGAKRRQARRKQERRPGIDEVG
jgi:ribosome-associated protein